MAAGTMIPLLLSDLKSYVPGVNPNDRYYLTDFGKEGEFYLEAIYPVPGPTPPTADDAITVNSNVLSGFIYRYRRVNECGVIDVRWFGATGDGVTDDAAAIQAAVSTTEGDTIVFDYPGAADYLVTTATITVSPGKKLQFRQGNRLIGGGAINGGIIDAGYDQQIFNPTLTIAPEGVANNMFSVKWFGAIGRYPASGDDSTAIQKAIDTVVLLNSATSYKIYFPSGKYLIDSPLIVSWFTGTDYAGITLELVGDATFWESSAGGTTIYCNFKDSFAIGIQNGKNVVVRGLYILGQFAPPTLTSQEFYATAFDDYVDPTCRDVYGHFSPYSGIVIDPFGPELPSDGGYPGLSSYYHGGFGGSTGTTIDNCFINNFVVGVCSSPNGQTGNAELTIISNTQFQFCKLAISSGQDQEKSCKIYRCACWVNTHTFFASRRYGVGRPGQWELDGVQIAGRVNTFVDHDEQGYAASFIRYCFAESLGRFGTWKGLKARVENCEFSFALPETETFSYLSYHVISETDTTFDSCNFRLYGTVYPITLVGGAIYKNCIFETVPYIGIPPYFLSAGFGPSFVDCMAVGQPFGPTQTTGIASALPGIPTYGSFKIMRSDELGTNDREFFIFNNDDVNLVLTPTGTVTPVITGTDNHFTFTALAAEMYMYEVGRLVVAYIGSFYQPMGIITAIDTGTHAITVSYASELIMSSTAYSIGICHVVTFGAPFIGDVTQGSNLITNVASEVNTPDLNVGIWIKSYCFVSNVYNPYVKILSYDSGTKTYTVSSDSSYTAAGVCFTNADGKEIDLLSANTTLNPASLLPVGAIITTHVRSGLVKYVVSKAGFANASAISDTRQAIWKMIAPNAALVYKVITDASYDVQLEDELLEVDATAGDVNINLQDDTVFVIPGNGAARLIRIKKIDSTANVVNINQSTFSTPQPIDGMSTVTLSSQYDSVTIYQGVSEFGTPGYIQNTGVIH
ncbi:MAG TPA: glycosyl hydrolase family 28-related protein [Chitinophagaceae bacterium]